MNPSKIIKSGQIKAQVEQFENFSELVNTINSRTRNFGSEHDSDWAGCTLTEAYNFIKEGWTKELQAVITEAKSLEKFENKISKSLPIADLIGYVPHVPNFLVGVPQSMVNFKSTPKKSKIVTIVYDGDVSSGVKTKEKAEYSSKIVAQIINLEKQGYRVRLYSMNSYNDKQINHDITSYSMFVKVKSEDQPIDIKRIMFPLVHIGYQRQIGFHWYETLPKAVNFGGYGRPLVKEFKLEDINDYIKQIFGKQAYYIYFGFDLKDIDKTLDKDNKPVNG